ncbi:MAG: gamma-glutamyl-gamma-aminobutyrate hydrolase family protein [Candidatus Dormibacteria bacterium]
MSRPLVAITCSPLEKVSRGQPVPTWSVNAAYCQAVTAAGGIPVLLPPQRSRPALREALSRLDGLLLPGGPDVDPGRYGAKPEVPALELEPERDELDLAALRAALAAQRPVLGICRGLQVLNVALGGTLVQDIPLQLPGSDLHQDEGPRDRLLHDLAVTPGTRLAGLLGVTHTRVNSLHHQAVDRLAPGLVASAEAPDGVIEGVEAPGYPFLVAVQFHPEELAGEHAPSRRLLERFIAACR